MDASLSSGGSRFHDDSVGGNPDPDTIPDLNLYITLALALTLPLALAVRVVFCASVDVSVAGFLVLCELHFSLQYFFMLFVLFFCVLFAFCVYVFWRNSSC